MNQIRFDNARVAFMHAIEELMSKRPVDKISVIEIAEKAKYSRKTFYENFVDKYDLIHQVYMNDLNEIVCKHGYRDYFAYVEEAVMLVENDFNNKLERILKDFNELTYRKRFFYARAFSDNSPNSLSTYLEKLSEKQCAMYINHICSKLDVYITDEEKGYFSRYTAAGITKIISEKVRSLLTVRSEVPAIYQSWEVVEPYKLLYGYLVYKSMNN